MANCAAWSHRWRPHPNHVSPKGVPHTTVTRTNVLNDPGQSTLEVARSAQVCERSVRRYQQRMADTGSVAPKAHTGGAAKKLTRADAYALYLMTMAKPSITRDEMQAFLVLNRAKLVSVWTNLFVNEVCRRAAAAAPGVRRIVLVDNAARHVPAELRPICQHWGCDLLQQPVHSPDFAPVEHCHSNVEQTLRRDARDITRCNFRDRVEAAYNAIGPAKARAFFSNAYYCVPGLPFTPYMGQQTT